MKPLYILDACAMLAVFAKEPGADKVVEIYMQAENSTAVLTMNKLNLLEVYYDIFRNYGKERADSFLAEVKKSPITIFHEITDSLFAEAGRLKATYKISLADSFAVAQAITSHGSLVTCDHHEFDTLDGKENVKFTWIR